MKDILYCTYINYTYKSDKNSHAQFDLNKSYQPQAGDNE